MLVSRVQGRGARVGRVPRERDQRAMARTHGPPMSEHVCGETAPSLRVRSLCFAPLPPPDPLPSTCSPPASHTSSPPPLDQKSPPEQPISLPLIWPGGSSLAATHLCPQQTQQQYDQRGTAQGPQQGQQQGHGGTTSSPASSFSPLSQVESAQQQQQRQQRQQQQQHQLHQATGSGGRSRTPERGRSGGGSGGGNEVGSRGAGRAPSNPITRDMWNGVRRWHLCRRSCLIISASSVWQFGI